jgi:hypothetical protein
VIEIAVPHVARSTGYGWRHGMGIQTYGFLPLRLPAEMRFTRLIHAADERVPAQEIAWGTDRIYEVLTRYR